MHHLLTLWGSTGSHALTGQQRVVLKRRGSADGDDAEVEHVDPEAGPLLTGETLLAQAVQRIVKQANPRIAELEVDLHDLVDTSGTHPSHVPIPPGARVRVTLQNGKAAEFAVVPNMGLDIVRKDPEHIIVFNMATCECPPQQKHARGERLGRACGSRAYRREEKLAR